MTTITLSYRAAQEKIRSAQLPKIYWKAYYAVMIAACLALLVSYIFFINQLTGGTYLIKNYEKEINTLTAQNKDLQTSFAESGFLGNVQSKVASMDFQKTTNVTYVQLLNNSLGLAK